MASTFPSYSRDGRPPKARALIKLAPAVLLGLLGFCPTAKAASDPSVQSGPWDMTAANGHRQCRIYLHPEAAGSGFTLSMPPGCKHAFALLAPVTTWSSADLGHINFDDAGGQPVLMFEARGATALQATGPDGEGISLTPVDPKHRAAIAAESASSPVKPVLASAGTAVALPKIRPSIREAELPGHYAVLRGDKDTGCMVTLEEKERGPANTLKARLAPACRDQGIVIFDPVGWQIQAGALVLTARKGHSTHLDRNDDGVWVKDPKDGKTMSLKRI